MNQTALRLGLAVRAARRAHGLTQAQLANQAHLCRASVVKVEAGQGRLATLLVLIAPLGLTVALNERVGSVGEALADLRRAQGLSLIDAADMAGLRVHTVAAIETDAPGATLASLGRLVTALAGRLEIWRTGTGPPAISAGCKC